MKVLAYIPLHYGQEYLEAVIKSIDPFVDQILILHTFAPSYGQKGRLVNPENRDDLYEIAHSSSNKIHWVEIDRCNRENIHRNKVFDYSRGYDLVMAVDADEVWHPDHVEPAIKAAYESKSRNIGVGGDRWYHFWRSFNEVNRDGFYPIRFYNLNNKDGQDIIHEGLIYHMGYAQSPEITEYKISVHGHTAIKGSWFHDKWLTYTKGETKYLHPESRDVWIETEPFDKTTLPEILKNHKNYHEEII